MKSPILARLFISTLLLFLLLNCRFNLLGQNIPTIYFDKPEGTYPTGTQLKVNISCVDVNGSLIDTRLFYTIDGSKPTTSSYEINNNGEILITDNLLESPITINVYATNDDDIAVYGSASYRFESSRFHFTRVTAKNQIKDGDKVTFAIWGNYGYTNEEKQYFKYAIGTDYDSKTYSYNAIPISVIDNNNIEILNEQPNILTIKRSGASYAFYTQDEKYLTCEKDYFMFMKLTDPDANGKPIANALTTLTFKNNVLSSVQFKNSAAYLCCKILQVNGANDAWGTMNTTNSANYITPVMLKLDDSSTSNSDDCGMYLTLDNNCYQFPAQPFAQRFTSEGNGKYSMSLSAPIQGRFIIRDGKADLTGTYYGFDPSSYTGDNAYVYAGALYREESNELFIGHHDATYPLVKNPQQLTYFTTNSNEAIGQCGQLNAALLILDTSGDTPTLSITNKTVTGYGDISANKELLFEKYYTLQGSYIGNNRPSLPGIYIRQTNTDTTKIFVK